MIKLQTPFLKTGEELDPQEIHRLIENALSLKYLKENQVTHPWLAGKHLALLFDKPSLRTRFSFTVAMNDLGGHVIESPATSRKEEWPEDLARVLGGYCDAIMVRTHEDKIIERMASVSPIPIINGLSDLHHPCQILSDFTTLQEYFGTLKGLRLAYVGDGNNILHSLLLMSPLVGIHLHYCTPPGYEPNAEILKRGEARACHYGTEIISFSTPQEAVTEEVRAVYTDVWTSMGFEGEKHRRTEAFKDFQVNERLMARAKEGAVFLHCLPMERGREVSLTLPDGPASLIFQQSENRLHLQKALLLGLMGAEEYLEKEFTEQRYPTYGKEFQGQTQCHPGPAADPNWQRRGQSRRSSI